MQLRQTVETILTIEEVAALLKVEPSVIRYWIRRNEFPYIRLGRHLRVLETQLSEWLVQKAEACNLEIYDVDLSNYLQNRRPKKKPKWEL